MSKKWLLNKQVKYLAFENILKQNMRRIFPPVFQCKMHCGVFVIKVPLRIFLGKLL